MTYIPRSCWRKSEFNCIAGPDSVPRNSIQLYRRAWNRNLCRSSGLRSCLTQYSIVAHSGAPLGARRYGLILPGVLRKWIGNERKGNNSNKGEASWKQGELQVEEHGPPLEFRLKTTYIQSNTLCLLVHACYVSYPVSMCFWGGPTVSYVARSLRASSHAPLWAL